MLEVLRQLHHLAISGSNLFDLLIARSIALYFKDRMQEEKYAGNVCAQNAADYFEEARITVGKMEARIKLIKQN